MFFFGSVRVKLDEKNRLRMPAKFTAILRESAIVMRGTQNSLFVMRTESMERMWDAIYNAPISDFQAQDTLRLLNSGTFEVVSDNQDRFVLPQSLKDYAKIDKNLVLVGMRDRIEIWAEDVFDAKYGVSAETIDQAVVSLKDRYNV